MKLPRPHIPIKTRIKVAKRQLFNYPYRDPGERDDVYLDRLLACLSLDLGAAFEPLHLDHDPALCNRKLYKSGKYWPRANDPKYLVYRTKEDHDFKTRLRGDGAQLSDLALRRKFKRIAKRTAEGKR